MKSRRLIAPPLPTLAFADYSKEMRAAEWASTVNLRCKKSPTYMSLIGQFLPRHLTERAAPLPHKAAAPAVRRRGSYEQ
jgi:hypothetical protein